MADHTGVFLPFNLRMGRQRQRSIIVPFMDSGEHISPSGTTARLVINHCLQNGFPFSVEYVTDTVPCYIVRLTGAEKAPWHDKPRG